MIKKVYQNFNRATLIFSLILFATIFSFIAAAQTSADLIKNGSTFLEQTEYQDALLALNKAIKLDANNGEAYYVRGKIHIKLLDMESAITDLDAAEEKGFNDIYLYVQKGTALQLIGKYKESIEAFTKALEKKSDDKVIWFKRAVSYQELSYDYEAMDDYTKAVKLDNGYFEALLNRCILFYENDNMKAAYRDCDKAINVRQNSADAYFYRGASKGAGDNEDKEAMADFNKALEINPDHDVALTARGSAKLILGNKKGACLDWNKAQKLGSAEAQEFLMLYCE